MEDIGFMVRTAFTEAIRAEIPADGSSRRHRERSRVWVEALANEFRSHYCEAKDVRVFSKHWAENRADFLLNELLYDVSVCRVASVASAAQKKELLYIKEVLWLVESEFAKNSRQALVDFNKLVMGASGSKLFVGPQVSDNDSFIQVLLPAAAACAGDVFLALLPHPAVWNSIGEARPLLWRFANGAWQPMQGRQPTSAST